MAAFRLSENNKMIYKYQIKRMETDYDTQLRDFYRSLDAFCEDRGLDRKELEDKLDMIDYAYDPAVNQFV